MDDIFHSSRASIEHAKRRNLEIDIELKEWLDSSPCESIVEPYGDGAHEIQKLKVVKPIPAAMGLVAFEAINSLRAALDQAGFACAVAAGTSGKRAHFPFGDAATDMNGCRERGSKNIPQKIFDLMVSFQPYKGGDDFLWAMNKICNSHKHEIIAPTAMVIGGMQVQGSSAPGLRIKVPAVWDRSKNEMELFTYPKGEKFKYDLKFQAFVEFANVDVARGMPVGSFFNIVMSRTDNIVATIEKETRKIGLIK